MTTIAWLDIAKLCVPFVFSLILLWAKQAYEHRRERKAKQEFLWRSISQGTAELHIALAEQDKIAQAFKEDRIRIVDFDIPSNLTDFANRLAELDPANSHIYSDYTSQIEIVRKGLGFLKNLMEAHMSANDQSRPKIAEAIRAQTTNIKKDLVTLARRELDLLRTIRETNKWSKTYQQQTIDQQASALEKASITLPKAS
jgi:hypothetical protein